MISSRLNIYRVLPFSYRYSTVKIVEEGRL